jgi:hypothetical protein
MIVYTEIRISVAHETYGDCGPVNIRGDLRAGLLATITHGMLIVDSGRLLEYRAEIDVGTTRPDGSMPGQR